MMKKFEIDINKAIENNFKVKTPIGFNDLLKKTSKELSSWEPQKNTDDGLIDVLDFFSGCVGMSLGFSALSQKRIYSILKEELILTK